MMSQFIALIRSQIDKGIYVWGGQGQVATEARIRSMETSTVNANRAIALLNKRRAEGVNPILMFDCSGLCIWALQTLGVIDYDTTADGLRRMCKVTTTPKVGDLAFTSFNSDGRAQHMGIVTRPGYVTEAKGRDDGVIESMSSWTQYGENPFIAEEVDEVLQKGDKGTAVLYWQQSLLKLGIKMINDKNQVCTADSDFQSGTANGTKIFQARVGLPVTGIVDTNTMTYMCNELQKITTGITQAQLDAEKARAAAAQSQVNVLTVEKNKLSLDLGNMTAENGKNKSELDKAKILIAQQTVKINNAKTALA